MPPLSEACGLTFELVMFVLLNVNCRNQNFQNFRISRMSDWVHSVVWAKFAVTAGRVGGQPIKFDRVKFSCYSEWLKDNFFQSNFGCRSIEKLLIVG